jgi:hypothetical protein
MKKHEIAVFIENEEMLREARELLEKYGEKPSRAYFYLSESSNVNNLQLDAYSNWSLFDNYDKLLCLITLPQLEEILKNQ